MTAPMHPADDLAVLRSESDYTFTPTQIVGPFHGFEYARGTNYYYRRPIGGSENEWRLFCGVERTLTEEIAASNRAETAPTAPTPTPSWADPARVAATDPSGIRHASPLLRFADDYAATVRRYAWFDSPDTIIVSTSEGVTSVSITMTPELIVRIANALLTDEERALIVRGVEAAP